MRQNLRHLGRRALALAVLLGCAPALWAEVKWYTFDVLGNPDGQGFTLQTKVRYQFDTDDGTIEKIVPDDLGGQTDITLTIPDEMGPSWEAVQVKRVAARAITDANWGSTLAVINFPKYLEKVDKSVVADVTMNKLHDVSFFKTDVRNLTIANGAFTAERCPVLLNDVAAHVYFNDGMSGAKYVLCPSTHEMKVNSWSYVRDNFVIDGEKHLNDELWGNLTDLKENFKGHTAHALRIAITDTGSATLKLNSEEFKNTNLAALSLPLSCDFYNFATGDAPCGDNVFEGCDNLQYVYAYCYGAPYRFKKTSDGWEAEFDLVTDDNPFDIDGSPISAFGVASSDYIHRINTTGSTVAIEPALQFVKGYTAYLKDGVVPDGTFEGNTYIGTLYITPTDASGHAITSIGANCFRGCPNLKVLNANVSDGSLTFGQSCFEDCAALEQVAVNGAVKGIGAKCFKNCASLSTLSFEGDNSDLTLGANCFEGCSALAKINLTNRQVKAEDGATPTGWFKNCPSLSRLFFSNDIGTPSADLLEGTDNLKRVNFVKTVTADSYTDNRFYTWTRMGVIKLDGGTFNGSNILQGLDDKNGSMVLRERTVTLGSDAPSTASFDGTKVTFCPDHIEAPLAVACDGTLQQCATVSLPYGTRVGLSCFDTSLAQLTAYDGYLQYVARFSQSLTATDVAISGLADAAEGDVQVPYTIGCSNVSGVVNSVQDAVGQNNNTVRRLTFAEPATQTDGALTIGAHVFQGATDGTGNDALLSVTFPKKRPYTVGSYAFSYRPALQTLELTACAQVADNAFSRCTALRSVRLGDTLVGLGAFAFACDDDDQNQVLTSVVLKQPADASVNFTAGEGCFHNCYKLRAVVQDLDKTKANFVQTVEAFAKILQAVQPTDAELYNKLRKVTTYLVNVTHNDVLDYTSASNVDYVNATAYRQMSLTSGGNTLEEGYGTICVPHIMYTVATYNVDKVYTAKLNASKTAVQLTAIDESGAAGQPFIFSRKKSSDKDADSDNLVVFCKKPALPTDDDPWLDQPLADDLLVGTFSADKPGTVPVGSYVLQSDNVFHIVGTSFSPRLGAYRAYLSVPEDAASRLALIVPDDTPTDIKGVVDQPAAAQCAAATLYNLNGQRVSAPVKGQIYIVGGKKVLY